MKHITDPHPVRHIRRDTYKEHADVPKEFDFKSQIILELNEIGNNYKEDIEAVKSRGLFVELFFSNDQIKNIMCQICHNSEMKEATEYLISQSHMIPRLNLRFQYMAWKILVASKRDGLDWKKEIDLYLKTQIPENSKLLYRFAGSNPVKRISFVKYLVNVMGWSLRTAQRRIGDALQLGEIFSDGKEKQAMLSTEDKW